MTCEAIAIILTDSWWFQQINQYVNTGYNLK